MRKVAATYPTDQNLTAQLQMAQLERIYSQQHTNGAFGQSLAVVLFSIIIAPVVQPARLHLWMVCFVLLQFVRFLHAVKFHALPKPLDAERRLFWFRTHVLAAALTAVLWSIGVYVLWPADSGFHQVAFLFVITTTATGALVGHAAHKWSYIAYTVLALVPIGVRFMIDGSRSHSTLGLSCFVTVALLLRIAARNHKASIDALVIGIKYRELATMLTDEKERTEALNHQLLEQAQALQESEARFRGLSDAGFEGIAIHDSGYIVDANQAALNMFGYTKPEIEGVYVFDLIAPEFHAITAQNVGENFDNPYEIAIVHKSGAQLPVEVQAKSVPYGDKQVRVVAIRDISFRKQLEQQALELKLEQARIDLLQTFFQNASHEFNTPLSVIKTSAYLAQRVDTAEKRQQSLSRIDEQVDRISQLVNDLAFMMRLDTGMELRYSETDVNALLRKTAATLEKAFTQKGQQLMFQLDNTLPGLQADPEVLAQAFHAILQNAERHTPEAGMITIRTHRNDTSILVEIQDNGAGMPEEALAHIFDRFYRVDEAHSTMGFGIGLSIARSIVELHRGSISAQSQANAGSTFTIMLPLSGE